MSTNTEGFITLENSGDDRIQDHEGPAHEIQSEPFVEPDRYYNSSFCYSMIWK